jgi:putative membrane protein
VSPLARHWSNTLLTVIWLGIFAAVLAWSAIAPKDYPTWALEVSPALLGLIVLTLTYNRFRLTPLLYWLILFHSVILMVGGHYTYAEVPLFDTLKPLFGWERNNYDKLGHLAQGFVPALIARELLVRFAVVSSAAWRNFFIVCFCLALSAAYELIEWAVAVIAGASSEAFLGTQGYQWDTQADMAFALLGSVAALLFLGGLHDRQLQNLPATAAR